MNTKRKGLLPMAVLALSLLSLGEYAGAANCTGNTNNKAVITAAANGNTVYQEGAPVTLSANTGNGKSFPLPPTGQYQWAWVSGPVVTLTPMPGTNNTSVSFPVPHVVAGHSGVLVLSLTVTGAACTGAEPSTDAISLNIANINNYPPVAVASASSSSVLAGTLVTLVGDTSYDPDSDPIKFHWSQTGGPAVALSSVTAANVNFTAPNVATTTTFTFQLKVTEDLAGSSLEGTTTVAVNVVVPGNQPPVAQLLCPLPVGEGQPVTLDGTGSYDPESGPLSYSWSQLDGFPLVTLPAGPYGNAISFTAPALGEGQPGYLTFGLTVIDNGTASASAQCMLFVNDVTPPSISETSDISAEATSSLGAAVSFDVTAYDNVVGNFTATCDPASGSTFSLGSTQVVCTAHDSAVPANTASASFAVTVVDTTPPVISAHSPVTAEATGADGAIVDYTSPASADAVAGDGFATCTPASASLFALGTTLVTCSASDGTQAATSTFEVFVVDRIAPVLTAPAPQSFEATGPWTALTSADYGSATATDAVGVVFESNNAPSQFPLGDTIITWYARDAATNSSTADSIVTVLDTTPPVIAAHDNIGPFEAASAAGREVIYTAPGTSDAVDGAGTADCAPASGSTFPLGISTVNCDASDHAGNAASRVSFTVQVLDTTPPLILDTPGNISVSATSAAGASVTINALPTATDIFGASVACKYTIATVTDAVLAAGATNFPVGTTTVTCTATDGNGLTSQSGFTVYVHYTFSGFLQPVDNLPTVNSVKAGSAIPVKFTLGGNMGMTIFATGYPKVLASTCGTGSADSIEETLTAGNSSLSYDAGTGKYIYVWKTDKAWIGACRQLKIQFTEGTVATASFVFK